MNPSLEVTPSPAPSENAEAFNPGKPENKFIANTATILGAQVGRAGIALLLEIIYARLLGPSGRGQMSLCMMVVGFGVLFGGLGGEIPIMLWAADERRKPSEWLPSIALCGLVGSLFASGAWVLLYWVWHPVFLKGITPALAFLLLLSVPFSIFGTYSLALLVGLERIRQRSALVLASQLILLAAVAIFLLIFGRQPEAAMSGFLVSLLVSLIMAGYFLKDRLTFSSWPKKYLKNISQALSLGFRGQLGNVATFFNYRLDVFIVNYYLNTTEVGLYSLGVVISEALWQLPNAAAIALVPRTARSIDTSDPRFTCLVCRQVFLIALLGALALALFSPWLVPLIFGQKFQPSVAVIWWILPGTVTFAAAKVMSADLMARGNPEYSAIFGIVTLVVTVVLDLYLIPRMGIRGAALASCVAYLINSVLVAVVLCRKLKVSWRQLFIPSWEELNPYRQVWNRLLTRVRPSPVA